VDSKKTKLKESPEAGIQREIVKYLKDRGWYVEVMHASLLLRGVPDLFAFHRSHGMRWIEVKNPKKYHFTRPQMLKFAAMMRAGIGIWIMTAANKYQYDLLWSPGNWAHFIGKSKVP